MLCVCVCGCGCMCVITSAHTHIHTHTLGCHSQCGLQYSCSLEFGSAPGSELGSASVATNDILAMLSPEKERVPLQKVWSSPTPSSLTIHTCIKNMAYIFYICGGLMCQSMTYTFTHTHYTFTHTLTHTHTKHTHTLTHTHTKHSLAHSQTLAHHCSW